MVTSSPHLYLDEFQDWFEEVTGTSLGISTLWYYIQRMGFSHKKFSIRAYQRDEFARAEHIKFVAQFNAKMFLFIDETSKDQRTPQRRHGYSPKGTRTPSMLGNFVRKHRISVMAGLDITGIVGSFIVEESFTSDLFLMAFQQALLPHLGKFSEQQSRSIVVMDNCSIHINEKLVNCIRKTGAIVHFLPPYSPDYNPIEMVFNYVKCWLRRNIAQAEQQPKASVYEAFDQFPEKFARNYVQACGY